MSRVAPAPWLPVTPAPSPTPLPSWLAPRKPPTAGAAPASVLPDHALEDLHPEVRRAVAPLPPPPYPPEPAPLVPPEPAPAAAPAWPDLREENADLRARLADAHAAMARLHRDVLERSEAELVRLALAVAERVVGRELAADPALVARWARDAVDALASREAATVAVAPDVAAAVARATPGAWTDALGDGHPLVVDPALPPGGCEVRAGASAAGASAADRLAALRDALGGDEP